MSIEHERDREFYTASAISKSCPFWTVPYSPLAIKSSVYALIRESAYNFVHKTLRKTHGSAEPPSKRPLWTSMQRETSAHTGPTVLSPGPVMARGIPPYRAPAIRPCATSFHQYLARTYSVGGGSNLSGWSRRSRRGDRAPFSSAEALTDPAIRHAAPPHDAGRSAGSLMEG
jgi:hypothetical protein